MVPAIEFPASTDTLYLTLADWLQLHTMIRSTAGIIDYVERALDSGIAVPLGGEADRFLALAVADVEACTAPSQFPTLYPAQLSDDEERYVALMDRLVMRVANSGNRGFHPESYLEIVEQLDRIPIVARARLGAKLERTLRAVADDGSPRAFIMTDGVLRSCLAGNRLAFICQRFNFLEHGPEGHLFNQEVSEYAAVRQFQALQHAALPESVTLVVGILYHPQFGPRYTFCLRSGPVEFDADTAALLERHFGVFDGKSVR